MERSEGTWEEVSAPWKGKAACLEFFEHRGVVVGAVVEHIFGLSCLENPKTPT